MIDFGDGREERMAALSLEMKLRANPYVTARRQEYERKVRAAHNRAESMGTTAVIERLISHNPSYIRELLETDDDRFGKGALASRYARTFWNEEA